jgi:hypothetical protein
MVVVQSILELENWYFFSPISGELVSLMLDYARSIGLC